MDRGSFWTRHRGCGAGVHPIAGVYGDHPHWARSAFVNGIDASHQSLNRVMVICERAMNFSFHGRSYTPFAHSSRVTACLPRKYPPDPGT